MMAPAFTIPSATKEALSRNPNSYVDLPPDVQRNETVALYCIQHGIRSPVVVKSMMFCCPSLIDHRMAWRMLVNSAVPADTLEYAGSSIVDDHALMKKAIQNCGPQVYNYLSHKLKDELALWTLKIMSLKETNMMQGDDYGEKLLMMIISRPLLFDHVDAWKLVVQILAIHRASTMFVNRLDMDDLWACASPVFILDNDEIMRVACLESRPGDNLQYASERIRRDVALLHAIIHHPNQDNKDNDFLLHVPPDVLLAHPSLIVAYLDQNGSTDILLDALPSSLWKNHDICKQYLRNGGKPFPDILGEVSDDWDLCLAHIEGYTPSTGGYISPNIAGCGLRWTKWISSDLLTNPTFLVEAAKRNQCVLHHLADQQQQKLLTFNVLLVTAAHHGIQPLRALQSQRCKGEEVSVDIVEFATNVKELLQLREHIRLLIYGICIHRPKCCLNMLNPDIAQYISGFLDELSEERYRHLRQSLPVAMEILGRRKSSKKPNVKENSLAWTANQRKHTWSFLR